MGEVNARLQHAVEHNEVVNNVSIQRPSELSVPKKGEIVFNRDITNFKVGDGTTAYGQLNNFIKSIVAASGSDIADVGTPSVTASTSGDTTTFTFHQLKGATGNTGNPGPQGTGINHIRKTSGSGAAGTIDTYTIYSSVEESASTILGTFNVYNGSDGNGISVKASAADCAEVGDAYIDRDSTSQTYGHIMILTSTSPREFTDGGNVQGPQGPQGIQGIQGNTGVGIASITKTATSGLVDTYTVTYTDSNTTTFNVTNGAAGQDGQDGQDGADGITPHIDSTTGNWFIGSTDTGIHAQGEQGVGIRSIVPPSTPGQTTDVYTIMSDEQTPSQLGTFTVYNGEDGEAGADGSTWYQGTAVNAATSNIPTGIKVGDYYLNISTLDVWKCISTTASAKWSLVCNIRGSKWFTGSGVPSTVVDSKIGDYYLNSSDGGVWEKTGETAWTYRTNIMGASGADGATWHSGTDVTSITSNVPSGVVVGDYYLNTNTYNVYKCISTTDSTKWSLECNIKGSQGNPGSNGNSVFISYSANADGNPNHSTFTTGDKYIGIYVGQSAPSSYTGYTWCKFIGDDGTSVTVNDTLVKIIGDGLTSLYEVFGTFTLNQLTTTSGYDYIRIVLPTFKVNGHNFGLVPVIPTENIGTLSSNSKQVLSEDGWKKIPTFGTNSTWGLVPAYTGSSSNLVLKSDGTWGSFSYSLDTSFYSSLPPNWSAAQMSSGENPLGTSKLNLIAGNNVTFNLVKDSNSDVAGIKINATGSSYTLPTATSGVLGGLIVHDDAPEQVELYIDTSSEHKCVPIYHAESTVDPVNSVDIGERHYVNLYDIAEALEHNTELRERFQSVLNMK